MKDSQIAFVDYKEATSIQVGNFLLSKGYVPASCSGRARKELSISGEVGIIYDDPSISPKKYFFGLITKRHRRPFIGTLWMMNQWRGADDTHWKFEIYGRVYVERLRQLAEELSSTFSVKITMHLTQERPASETYTSDYGW